LRCPPPNTRLTELSLTLQTIFGESAREKSIRHEQISSGYVTDARIGVTVEAEGYEPLTSPVVGVPPEVTDLDLALTPIDGGDFIIYLPLVLRQP